MAECLQKAERSRQVTTEGRREEREEDESCTVRAWGGFNLWRLQKFRIFWPPRSPLSLSHSRNLPVPLSPFPLPPSPLSADVIHGTPPSAWLVSKNRDLRHRVISILRGSYSNGGDRPCHFGYHVSGGVAGRDKTLKTIVNKWSFLNKMIEIP